MSIYKLKPKSLVTYVGKNGTLQNGRSYTVKSLILSKGILLLELEYSEGKFDYRDFIGEPFNFDLTNIRENFLEKISPPIKTYDYDYNHIFEKL